MANTFIMWRIVATDVSGLQPGASWVISAGYGGKSIKSPPIDAGSAGPKATFRFKDVAESDVTVTLEKDGAPAGDAALSLAEYTQNATDFQKSLAIGSATVALTIRRDLVQDDDDEQASCMETGDSEESSCVIS